MNQLPTITELSLKYIPPAIDKHEYPYSVPDHYGMSMKWTLVTPEGKTTMHGVAERYPIEQSIADSIIALTKIHEVVYAEQCKLYASTGYVTSKQVRESHDAATTPV
jgi:hypothetical protein